MRDFRRIISISALCSLACLAQSQVLQSESFDAGFTLGDLAGQGGWIVAPGGSLGFAPPGIAQITSAFTFSGSRGVELRAADLLPGESVFAYRPLASPVGFGSQGVVVSEAWIRFSPNASGGRRGIFTYDTIGSQLSGLTVDSGTGLLFPDWIIGPSPLAPLSPNSWHRLTLAQDMLNGRAQGYVNGMQVSSQAGTFMGANFSDVNLFADGDGAGSVFFDNVRVERMPLGVIRGRVELGDFTASPAGRPVQIKLINPATGGVAQTINTALNAEGEYTGVAFIRGTFSVQVKPWHWTSKTLAARQIADIGLHFLQSSHANGDVDGSDEVDAADIDAVIADFGATGLLVSDVDGSAEVDAADIDIVIGNFGAVGD